MTSLKLILVVFLPLITLFPQQGWCTATSTRWSFISAMTNKDKLMGIGRKEFCRPFSPPLMSSKCRLYKAGYVCRQQAETLVIATYPTKKECEMNLQRAKRRLARR